MVTASMVTAPIQNGLNNVFRKMGLLRHDPEDEPTPRARSRSDAELIP
jgi:hypothetical protein